MTSVSSALLAVGVLVVPMVVWSLWSRAAYPCACASHVHRQRGSQDFSNPSWNGSRPPDFLPCAVPDLPMPCRDCTCPMVMLHCWPGRSVGRSVCPPCRCATHSHQSCVRSFGRSVIWLVGGLVSSQALCRFLRSVDRFRLSVRCVVGRADRVVGGGPRWVSGAVSQKHANTCSKLGW